MTAEGSSPERIGRRADLLLLIAVALAVRVVALGVWHERLRVDVDAYLALAAGIAEGNGFVAPESGAATAYRPPLYPLLLAPFVKAGATALGVAVLNLIAGVATVGLTWLLARRLDLQRGGAFVAGALVAVDPLLVQYTASAMTEVVFTALVALLLVCLSVADSRKTAAPAMACGVVFGLTALCRPTVWPFGALLLAWWLVRGRFVDRQRISVLLRSRPLWLGVLAAGVTVAPWVVRNTIVFGRPILTTTHGGYTLLLGNNPVFYRQVVDRPWGTVWDDAPADQRQAAWYERLKVEMTRELGPAAGEIERDQWMTARARLHIANEPTTFLRACWLRFRRFWNIVPLSAAAGGLPRVVLWAVGVFYAATFATMLAGLVRLTRAEWRQWMPVVLLIVSVTALHLVYWSNTRMRAPLVPAIALLAGRGVERRAPK